MANELILRHRSYVANNQIGRFEVVFPDNVQKLEKFVRVGRGKDFAILKVSKRNVDGVVYVIESTLKDIANDTPIEWHNRGFVSFNWYKITHDTAHCIAFIALLLAIIGTIIDGSFAIGKSGTVWIHLSQHQITFWMSVALWFKVIGLIIVFVKTLLDGK